MRLYFPVLTFLTCLTNLPKSTGQVTLPDTLQPQILAEATVNATRLPSNVMQAPFSISVLPLQEWQSSAQGLTLQELLPAVPGVFSMNADNYAQDLRISIRGFGARAAFGIRGLRLLVDDLPESTPDGQGQVDNIDMGILARMEVLRGPVSGLYGNAAGGAICLYTETPTAPVLEGRLAGGSFGFRQAQLKAGNASGLIHASWTEVQGYRDHSAMRTGVVYGKYRFRLGANTRLQVLGNYANSPQADDPGAITLAQADTARRSARDLNLRYQAGETLWQGRAGAVLEHQMSVRNQLKVKVFHTIRDFENKLPTQQGGVVAFRRHFSGASAVWMHTRRRLRAQAGIDAEIQTDNRQRYANQDGVRGGLSFDQQERFASLGVFWLNEWSPVARLRITGNLRFDQLRLSAADRFQQDGDDSGARRLYNWSPSLGFNYRLARRTALYGNVSNTFEAPALTELSANPTGGGGFNPALEQQRALGGELGIKSWIDDDFYIVAAAFFADARNEFVPYEIDSLPGRTYYRNAGRSLRSGWEGYVMWQPIAQFSLSGNFTLARYVYSQYVVAGKDLSNKSLPGLPPIMMQLATRWQGKKGLSAGLNWQYSGSLFTEDTNQTRTSAWSVLNARFSWTFRCNKWSLEPFAGVNNAFNTMYYANIRINAVAARYYEPASGINGYAGLRVAFK